MQNTVNDKMVDRIKMKKIVAFLGMAVFILPLFYVLEANAHHCHRHEQQGLMIATAQNTGGCCDHDAVSDSQGKEVNCHHAKENGEHNDKNHSEVSNPQDENTNPEAVAALLGNQVVCPVMQGKPFSVTDKSEYIRQDGKIYFFCCPPCKDAFVNTVAKENSEQHQNPSLPEESCH